MRKTLLFLIVLSCSTLFSQSRGVRVAYIDMDYILSKVSSYAEAKNQLEQKAVKWKQEIEVKKTEISTLKEGLKTERPLLTKELIEEREEEIAFLEKDLLDYQEKRFGAQGDLIVQKTVLIKPVQDQVFTAIQDIAEQQKYDFVFDKSSDLTILFANKRNDISDKVLRIISRAENREELSKKQLKEQEARDAMEDMEDENPELAARRLALEEKKAAREKLMEERQAAREKQIEDRKAEAEARRQKAIEAREGKKNGTEIDSTSEETKTEGTENLTPAEQKAADAAARRKQLADERAKKIEERQKELEARRQKAIEDREAAKKAREAQQNNNESNEEEQE